MSLKSTKSPDKQKIETYDFLPPRRARLKGDATDEKASADVASYKHDVVKKAVPKGRAPAPRKPASKRRPKA